MSVTCYTKNTETGLRVVVKYCARFGEYRVYAYRGKKNVSREAFEIVGRYVVSCDFAWSLEEAKKLADML